MLKRSKENAEGKMTPQVHCTLDHLMQFQLVNISIKIMKLNNGTKLALRETLRNENVRSESKIQRLKGRLDFCIKNSKLLFPMVSIIH